MNNDYFNQNSAPEQPLYEQKNLPDPKSMMIIAIVGLALGFTGACTIAGIILCAIAASKVKSYIADGGAYEGMAKVAKILSTVGIWVSIAMTVIMIISFIIGLIIGFETSYYSDAYYTGTF